MTPEERIAALETRLAKLVSDFQELRSIVEQTDADQSMLLPAVLSLIEAAPNVQLLGPVLRLNLAKVESLSVFQAQNEEQLEAAQTVQADLLNALAKAESRGP